MGKTINYVDNKIVIFTTMLISNFAFKKMFIPQNKVEKKFEIKIELNPKIKLFS